LVLLKIKYCVSNMQLHICYSTKLASKVLLAADKDDSVSRTLI
jgi:hypothetical protein